MRLVVIHHDRYDPRLTEEYYIHAFTAHWERQGLEVCHVAGTSRLPPGDLALVHVDLSVVPTRFLRAAIRYPVVLNGAIRDIRKRSLPARTHVLHSPADSAGPVIVKTDLNNAGIPESNAYRKGGRRLPLHEQWALFKANNLGRELGYRYYESSSEVPPKLWNNRDYVIEKFLPEIDHGNYVVRSAYFLGTCHFVYKLYGPNPIVRWHESSVEVTDSIDPEIAAYRKLIHLDYGKIDYTFCAGRPTILDVNKTIGGPTASMAQDLLTKTLMGGLDDLTGLGTFPSVSESRLPVSVDPPLGGTR